MGLIDRVREFTGFGKTEAQDAVAKSDRPLSQASWTTTSEREVPWSPEEKRMVRPLLLDPAAEHAAAEPERRRPARPLLLEPGSDRSVAEPERNRTVQTPRPFPAESLDPPSRRDGADSLARVARTKDLEEVTRKMQAMYGKAAPRDVMAVLGRNDGRDTDFEPPRPGAKRDRWIAERVALAFDPKHDYRTHPAHSQAENPQTNAAVESDVGKLLLLAHRPGMNLHAMASAARAHLSENITDFMQDGKRLEDRIRAERQHLERAPREEVEHRFLLGPSSTVEPMPEGGRRKGEWIEDRLRSEHAAARAGLMYGSEISMAAMAERGQRPFDPDARMPKVDWSELNRVRDAAKKEAQDFKALPDQGLRSRYRGVPGIDKVEIPPIGSTDRVRFIETVSHAQRVQDVTPRRERTADLDLPAPNVPQAQLDALGKTMRNVAENMNKGPKKGPPPPGMIAAMNHQNGR